MMSRNSNDNSIDCAGFEAQVGDFVGDALDEATRVVMEEHERQCAACRSLVTDLRAIVVQASQLPLRKPSRDLWPGIAARLDTPVVALEGHAGADVAWSPAQGNPGARTRRTVSMRVFAAAAALLIALSSGATWLLSRPQGLSTPLAAIPVRTDPDSGSSAPLAPERVAPSVAAARADSPAATNSASPAIANGGNARTVSHASGSRDAVYEREIGSLRRIVDERLGDLDSATVVEIERNLAIIDKAIADSQRALDRDPRSRFLSTQLDRALANKLAILRRVALL